MSKLCGLGVVAIVLAGAVTAYAEAQPAGKSLYERLGGKPAITSVVNQFVSNVAADARISGRFATTDIPQLKAHLVDQICSAAGGPCSYKGRDMKTTHAGMRIANADFAALVEDLTGALTQHKVPQREQQELLGLLGPMKKDIVEVP
ncbi:Hemoglobin-like protein [Nitrospira sp. KM1]|uniref:group I truncated hemoglobin n=1 Tax=Nitrospira sp. KM1 TaxID=1936990 RepID=UPI0013A71755|nr:group 1 truncated hemoglobin [Nitrospira sp. KM1]BCA55575.1 Hemoglobin-like protein [Nitrospira sp. KM1]